MASMVVPDPSRLAMGCQPEAGLSEASSLYTAPRTEGHETARLEPVQRPETAGAMEAEEGLARVGVGVVAMRTMRWPSGTVAHEMPAWVVP